MSLSSHARMLSEFDRARPTLDALQREVCAQLEPLLAQVATQSIAARVKHPQSVAGKLARPEKTYQALTDMTDLLGVRVITYFEDGVDKAARLIEGALPVDLNHTIDKRAFETLDRFGYRSLHYVCHAPAGFLERHGAPWLRGLRYEIQVRTILQHAWAEIEHDMGYKSSSALPPALRRRFSRLAGLLELADEEFVGIRQALHAHQRQIEAQLAQGVRRIPLDLHVLERFLEDDLIQHTDATLARHLGMPRSQTPFYPDYLLRMLSLVGLDHLEDLQDALETHGPDLTSFLTIYFDFSRAAWGLSPEDVQHFRRGYSLLFLAHRVLYCSPGLDIERVTRATEFFNTLDQMNDTAAARLLAVSFFRPRSSPAEPPTKP